MAADPIISLRPADSSAVAISAAIARARAMLADCAAAETTAQQNRDAALLDATPQQLGELEKKLTEARSAATAMRERVGAVLTQLEARLIVARRAETEAKLAAAKEAAERSGRELAEWFAGPCQETVLPILRRGEELDAKESSDLRQWEREYAAAVREYPDLKAERPLLTGIVASDFRETVAGAMQPVRLPVVFLPPSPREEEMAERRRQIEADETGGILGSGRRHAGEPAR